MINELVDEYSPYLTVDIVKALAPVEETIEDMLTRLEEFESLVAMVSADGTECLNGPIPEILARRDELQALCAKVDNLEVLVGRVKKDVAAIETQMDAAEAELGPADNTFKNIFKPFFKKSDPLTPRPPRTYEAPDIFRTSDFFPSQEPQQEDTIK